MASTRLGQPFARNHHKHDGYWVASGLLYMLGVGPLMDLILGRAKKLKPPPATGQPFETLLYAHAMLQCASILSLIYRASIDGPQWPTWMAALSTGLCSGASGIIVAHELGHKKPRSVGWWIGRFNLLSVLYLHLPPNTTSPIISMSLPNLCCDKNAAHAQ